MEQEVQHRPSMTEKHEAIIKGQTITYTVRRSLRVKRVRLEVRLQTGLTVIVPRFYDMGQLPGLLKSKERWISNNMARFRHFQSLSVKKKLSNGDTIPYLGRDLKLIERENHDGIGDVKLEGDMLAVSPGLFKDGILELALEQWYRAEAARLINERAGILSSDIGVSYKRIVIRGQRTRWGSCSRKKNLSFNWKLMMAPEPVIDYVIIHELAHLKEMNHSKRFWELVAKYCPGWREHKKWLKQHEANLSVGFCT